MKKSTTKQFIEKAKLIHHNKYDYSLVKYINNKTKVKIICPVHNIFEQTPSSHLSGNGCPYCAGKNNNSFSFIEKVKTLFPNYDYSKTVYKKAREKCVFICPTHGEFLQTPDNLLHKHGCPKCGALKRNKNKRSNTKEFISKANKIHHNKYDYSLVNYINAKTKIKIVCPVHGVFEQIPTKHLSGQGCPECGKAAISQKSFLTTKQFIEKAKLIHGDKYDYSLVNYIDTKTKVKIICPIHGIFEQTPEIHLMHCGCQKCSSYKGEEEITKILKNNNIKFIQQYRFEDCKDKNTLPFDFYLPDYNLVIEFQGNQHYDCKAFFFGSYDDFLLLKHHDWLKRKYCRVNNINYLAIKYSELKNIESIISKILGINNV